jgi:4-hydroxy-3-methylbut-2-en-1-yl diphosphate synthase IspG/GcpE
MGQAGFFLHIRQLIPPKGQQTAFSQPAACVPRAQWLSVAEITKAAQKITDQFKTPIPMEVVDTVANIPGHAKSTDVASGATTNDRIYLIREGLQADNIEVTVFHNAFHFQAGRLQSVEWSRKVETYAMVAFLGIVGDCHG